MEHHHHHHHHDEEPASVCQGACGCGAHAASEHAHTHGHASLKRQWLRIALATALLVVAVSVSRFAVLSKGQELLLFLLPYLAAGAATLREAGEGLLHGNPFNEHFLMTVATLGALGIGFLPGAETQYPEAVVVMLFFQVGELFEGYAENRSRKSMLHLLRIRPDVAHVERNGEVTDEVPEKVGAGELLWIRPGEKVPLDGVIVSGATSLNTLALTGESLPVDAGEGDAVLSGCVNLTGVVKVRTTKAYAESTLSKVIRLVEEARERKSKSEAFITRFARVYTPVVVFSALLVALLPPVLSGDFSATFPDWLYRALMFLVVSCPCALVLSVPLTFFSGMGGASRSGILVKGANAMDVLAGAGTVVFDKTGTLTCGQFEVEAVHPERCDAQRLLHLAAHVEHFTTHPVGAALRDAFPDEACDGCVVENVEEIAGQGIRARVGAETVCVGNVRMMEALGVSWRDCHLSGTVVHVAIDGEYAGHVVIRDRIKEDSAEAVAGLRALGVCRVVMLTGDREEVAAEVARAVGIDEYHAGMLPADKVACVERLLHERDGNAGVVFVGDGINDAPVLARSDLGIAMGGLGSDAAIEAADVVLMDDKPSKIVTALRIARRTLRISRQNVTLAIGVKLSVLLLAVAGLGALWMAVFADVGVTVLAVLNAMRAFGQKENA